MFIGPDLLTESVAIGARDTVMVNLSLSHSSLTISANVE
jgi:hypothetical protein